METNTGALSSLNTNEPVVTAQTKAVAPKNKYALPAPTGTVGLDPSILESMQQIINQKEAKRTSFMEGLKDVMAYDVGFRGDINKSVRERAAEKEGNVADIFQMKTQIAQQKAAQEQAQRQARSLSNIATGQPATGAGTVGDVGGADGTAAVPASVRAEINRRLQGNDLAGAQKTYDDWFKTQTEETIKMETSPGAYEKKVEMEDADGKTFFVDALTARQMRIAGTAKPTGKVAQSAPTSGGITPANIATVESGGDPNAVSPKGARGVMQVMPNTQKDPGFGVAAAKDDSPAELQRVGEDYYAAMQKKYGNDTLAAIAYNMGPGATDDWLSKGGDFNKLPAETQSYIGKVYTANALASRQPAAPAASTAPPGAVRTETRTREAVEKTGQEEFARGTAKESAATAAAIDKAGMTAGDDYVRASEIVKIASDPTMQEMFGVLEKGGVAPFILRQMENAINAGQFGTFGVKGLADNLAKAGATPDQIAKYDRMVRNLATAELKWAQVYLKGQGAVSDAERELIRKAVGSASGNPAKVLVMQGRIMEERAKFDADMSKAYDAYREQKGSYADFPTFMRTAGRPIIQKHTRDLASILGVDPGEVSGINPYKIEGASSGSGQSIKGPSSDEKKRWNERYGKKG
jgi:hypothetical protein